MSKVADLKVTVDDMSEPKAYLTAESNSKLTPDNDHGEADGEGDGIYRPRSESKCETD